MKPHRILKDFKGTQTGLGDGEMFKAGTTVSLSDHLAEVAYGLVHGAFTDDQREGVFGAAIDVPDDATAQDKLLAYTGRDPGAAG